MSGHARLSKPIVVAALIAGALDLLYASTHLASYYQLEPMQILQSIARGVLGPAVMQGGWGSASLGIELEFTLTLIMAAVYIAPAIHLTDLRKYWWLLGPCYGIVVTVVMYAVVLPLSAFHGTGALPDGPRAADDTIADHQMSTRRFWCTCSLWAWSSPPARIFCGQTPVHP